MKALVCNQLTVRSSKINKEWNEAIGKALETIPINKLPTQRVILQRFRAEKYQTIPQARLTRNTT